ASSIPATIALDDEPSPWDSGISLCISICRAGSSLLYFSAMERAVVNTKFVSSDGSTDSAKSLKDTLKESESVDYVYKHLLLATSIESNPRPRLSLEACIFNDKSAILLL